MPVNKECCYKKKTVKVGPGLEDLEVYPISRKGRGRVLFFFSVCLSLHLDHCVCIYRSLLLANDTRLLTEIFYYNINH